MQNGARGRDQHRTEGQEETHYNNQDRGVGAELVVQRMKQRRRSSAEQTGVYGGGVRRCYANQGRTMV